MKLVEKYAPAQLERPSWAIFQYCDVIFGHILDDKFEKPHVNVYEHVRHTFDEMFHHPQSENEPLPIEGSGAEDLASEEKEILSVLTVKEDHRRLAVVGDVGVGKTTFLKHLIEMHLNTPAFGSTRPIYLDWKAFTAPLQDPLPAIYTRFSNDVYASLERTYTSEELHRLDDEIFWSAPLFAGTRSVITRFSREVQVTKIADAIERTIASNPVDMAFERINALCALDRNALVLIIDNIDQLHPSVLDHLFQFLIEIQTRTVPLVVVAMRDHTFERGFSAYRREGTTTAWSLRLRAPDIRKLLERRLQYFLPAHKAKSSSPMLIGNIRVELEAVAVCRTLLSAPFSDSSTYAFVINWANFNVRELFAVIQQIISNSGFSSFDKAFVLSRNVVLNIGVDECVVALGLRNFLMFYPNKSAIFNPYSAGLDAHPCDQLVASRMLQYLMQRGAPVPIQQLRSRFIAWGYTSTAIESQIKAMAGKDVVWTSAGPPSDIDETSHVRLSYRGALYVRHLLHRAVFNYMMSFDVHAPNETHPIFRHHKSEFRKELEEFANFDQRINAEALSDRVLGLAQVMFEAEETELRELKARKVFMDFKAEVAPTSISVTMVEGLARLLQKSMQSNGTGYRLTDPSHATLQQVAERKEQYQKVLSHAW